MTLPSQEITDANQVLEIRLHGINELQLPYIIQEQVGKLKELDEGVKRAIDAATKAEQRAKNAGNQSAGWDLLGRKKKVAIEELQSAGMELADAVQLGAKAQKLSFELQTRLGDVTKYLFNLGTNSLAANRIVLRELELRLSGASEEVIGNLARQELDSLVRQLKEQEDLLSRQEQTMKILKEHDQKIVHLLGWTDEFGVQPKELMGKIKNVAQSSEEQFKNISRLEAQLEHQQAHSESLTAEIANVRLFAEQASNSLTAQSQKFEIEIHAQDEQQRSLAGLVESLIETSRQKHQAISILEQKISSQQAEFQNFVTAHNRERSIFKWFMAFLAILITSFPITFYFWGR